MDILDIFGNFYLNHLSPLWGYSSIMKYGKIEGNKYLQLAAFCIYCHFDNCNKTIFQRVHNETF